MQATIAQTTIQVTDSSVETKQQPIPSVEEMKLLSDYEMTMVGGGDGAPEWGYTGP